jgi:hypothetical protein
MNGGADGSTKDCIQVMPLACMQSEGRCRTVGKGSVAVGYQPDCSGVPTDRTASSERTIIMGCEMFGHGREIMAEYEAIHDGAR